MATGLRALLSAIVGSSAGVRDVECDPRHVNGDGGERGSWILDATARWNSSPTDA